MTDDELAPPDPRLSAYHNPATGHVTRAATVEKLRRLNELERILPIYRQALETIAGAEAGPWGRVADKALREALRG